jgi:hypothetical protein
MDTIVIVLIIIIVLLIFFLYRASSSKSSTNTVLNLNNTNTAVANADLSSPASAKFSYECWMYVNTWTNNAEKTAYYAGTSTTSTDSSNLLRLHLDKTTPTLYCKFNSSDSTNTNPPITITTNFPIQKWVYVIISVDSQMVDCYLDGKLVKSHKLQYLPDTSGTYNINFGSFDAYLTGFKRNANAINPQTAWSNYMAGNGYSSGSSYGVNIAITKDNVTMSQVSY